MVTLEFISAQRDEVREEGPFEFVQITYNTVRVGPEGEDEIALFRDGWWTHRDGSTWSDVSIYMADGGTIETIAIALQATLDSVRCTPEPITGEEALRMLDERLRDDGVDLRIQFERPVTHQ